MGWSSKYLTAMPYARSMFVVKWSLSPCNGSIVACKLAVFMVAYQHEQWHHFLEWHTNYNRCILRLKNDLHNYNSGTLTYFSNHVSHYVFGKGEWVVWVSFVSDSKSKILLMVQKSQATNHLKMYKTS